MEKGRSFLLVLCYTLLLSACASKTYEWIKINPDRLKAHKSSSSRGGLKTVNMTISLKEKEERNLYYENAEDYLSANPQNITSTQTKFSEKKKSKFVGRNKSVVSSPLSKKFNPSSEPEFSVDKLNSSLRLPKKKAKNSLEKEEIVKADKSVKAEDIAPSIAIEIPNEGTTESLATQNEELYKNNEPVQDFSSSSQVQDEENLDVVRENSGKKNSYMWVGLVLLVIGLIIGLIFGGMAYLISVAGIVFLFIGYFTRV